MNKFEKVSRKGLTLVRVGSISPFIDSGGAAGGGAVRLKIWNLASD
jgi:hypothetical protein